METYKPWDFCRSINCNALIRTEPQREQLCKDCKAYQMHDYLREKGSIIEEDSKLPKQIEWLKSEVNRLQVALDATIAEKERCRNLAVDWALKSDGFEMALRRCENMKLAHEFENLLQTTSIPVAVENVKELINIAEAAKELMNWHKSLTAEPKKETVVNKLKKLLISAGYNIIPSIATKEVSK